MFSRSNTNTRMGLQEAFQLHKKGFISHSNQRVQNIKDVCLQEKHSNNLLIQEASAKQHVGVIQRGRVLYFINCLSKAVQH